MLDNNESFSSLWHAANLYRFGFEQTFGITDESYGLNPEAHPYVYTHQGNFPRLFAWLIYALGARSIESQIVVTTFTVGVAATALAYQFFARVMTPMFGFIACVVLMTDYLLVAQWQIVTYRVWHEFFVFSSLVCAHGYLRGGRWWRVATIANFACLFYFEFVFVAFVALAAALYAAFVSPNTGKVVRFVALQTIGAAIGICALLTQLVLLLGWQDVLQDAYLTFVARNRYLSDPDLLREMKEFFDSRNIVFWYNLLDGGRFRNFGHFVASVTVFEFQMHTPLFTAVTGILSLGLLAGGVAAWWRSSNRPSAATVAVCNIGSKLAPYGLARLAKLSSTRVAGLALSAVSVTMLLLATLGGDWAFGIWRRSRLLSMLSDPLNFCVALVAMTAVAIALYGYRWGNGNQGAGASISSGRSASMAVALLVLLVSAAALFGVRAYHPGYVPLLEEVMAVSSPGPTKYLLIYLSVFVGAALMIRGAQGLLDDKELRGLCKLTQFLAAGFISYAVVYALSPGYIFSGYRFRLAPFTVFHTDTIVASAIFALVVVLGRNRERPLWFERIAAGVLLLLMLWFWGAMQHKYMQLLPADNYQFLKLLSAPPYKGKSFIVSTYAAPIAAATGQWAYFHAALAEGKLLEKNGRVLIEVDSTYLWFADRHTNPAYLRPDYFICVTAQSLPLVVDTLLFRSGRGPAARGCSDHVLVRLATGRDPRAVTPAVELVAIDQDGRERVGFERWAIVKLNWDQGSVK